MHRIRSRWEAVPTVTVEKVKSIRSRSHTQVLRRSSTRFAVTALVLATFGLASCSVSSKGTTSTTKPSKPAATASYRRPACRMPAPTQPIQAAQVRGVANGWTVTSFDGTKLRAYWFPVSSSGSHRYPTVLMGPGWGETADTSLSAAQLFGGLSIDTLHSAGFNVMTWDPRGFGASGGLVELDSYSYEARDVEQLIDWLATMPGVQLDGPNQPAVGMVGGSYGGGIQFTSAALDCRIDAIVPEIAWHSLGTSLFPNNTVKGGWGNLLLQTASETGMHLDPRISAGANAIATGVPSPAEVQFETSVGPGDLVSRITAPTLIIQGTVDNLFPLEEGVTNYDALQAKGVPVKMIWFCGGHGICLTPAGNQQMIADATVSWLNRWVKETNTATGPGFSFVDQNGDGYSASRYPIQAGDPTQCQRQRETRPHIRRWLRAGSHPDRSRGCARLDRGWSHPGHSSSRRRRRHLRQQSNPRGRGAPTHSDLLRHVPPGGQTYPRLCPDRRRRDRSPSRQPARPPSRSSLTAAPTRSRCHSRWSWQRCTRGPNSPCNSCATSVAYATPRLGGSINFKHVRDFFACECRNTATMNFV